MTAAEANALGLAVAPQREFLNGAPVHNWYDDVLANEAGAWSKANQFTGPNSQATPEKIAAWNKFVADKIAASQAAANPGGVVPRMPPGWAGPSTNVIDPNDLTPREMIFDNDAPQIPGQTTPSAPNTFLPPYLQPGGTAQVQPQAMLAHGAPPGSWDTITNGVPNIPGAGMNPRTLTPTSITRSTAPISSSITGMPLANTNRGGGSFAATAKLLELPYYLRNFGRQTYGRR